MKPLLKIVETQQNRAFQVMKLHEPHFFPSWHFHPECEQMLQLVEHRDGKDRIVDLLRILNLMAGAKEYELLSSTAFTNYVNADDCERINKVCQFIIDNYARTTSNV